MKVMKDVTIRAFELGSDNPLEKECIDKGMLKYREDHYEIFSLEVNTEKGEVANKGDFVLFDVTGNIYPNRRDRFLKNYVPVEGDTYKNVPTVFSAWMYGQGADYQLDSLVECGKLKINKEDPDKYFEAELWGTVETAKKDAIVLFYNDKLGQECDFNFVARDVFDATYKIVG